MSEAYPEFDPQKQIITAGARGGKTAAIMKRLRATGGFLACPSEESARSHAALYGGEVVRSETTTPELMFEDEKFPDLITGTAIVVNESWYVKFDPLPEPPK